VENTAYSHVIFCFFLEDADLKPVCFLRTAVMTDGIVDGSISTGFTGLVYSLLKYYKELDLLPTDCIGDSVLIL
jgi:hypothetical protein